MCVRLLVSGKSYRSFQIRNHTISAWLHHKTDDILLHFIIFVVSQVNEEGSEGAAATAMIKKHASNLERDPSPELHFDRPFVFFIKDMQTGLILFQGRVVDPSD